MKIEGVGTRLEKPTETFGLNKGEHMDPRCCLGGQYRTDSDP